MKRFWLFGKSGRELSTGKKIIFWSWNGLVLLMAAVCLGGLSLFFAYGDYPDILMKSYFQMPLIAVLNILPVILSVFTLYALLGRPWLAFLISSALIWGGSLGNYYKLRFRDDPVIFEDIRNLTMAARFAGDYDMMPDKRIWFGIGCVVLGTLFLLFLVRGVPRLKVRLPLLLLAVLLWIPMWKVCTDRNIYNAETQNYTYINRWSSTQVYISKGFVYPFIYSSTTGSIKPPEGYNAREAQQLLESGEVFHIPEAEKVDIITLQLEAFADFSLFEGVEGIDFERAYETYHAIEAESYSGTLLTNIFAGGTVDTERAFLTGYADQWNYRTNTNSYGWYFDFEGYTVEGCHPSYDWFYNRKNVNPYLGVPVNWFYENRFSQIYTGGIATDDVLFPEIFRLYEKNRDGEGEPYFSFNVTYQGHGPYSTEDTWRGQHYTDGRYSTETANIVDNYLASLQDTAEQLRLLLDEFAAEERPVVVIGFGDHKPWLGDGNSAYHELGVNIDSSTVEGFYNYYGTRYFIWANDAAKAALKCDFTGEGPDVSPCFLMNLFFDLCGWKGDGWTQATTAVWREIPALTSVGRYVGKDGLLVETLDADGQNALETYRQIQYYHGTHFCYE